MDHVEHSTCGCSLSRRKLLGGSAAALGIAATGGLNSAFAQSAAPAPAGTAKLIDVHHHLYPPSYIPRLLQDGPIPPFVRDWTPERSIEDMDRGNVGTALVTVVPSNLALGKDNGARALVRGCNDYGTKVAQSFPGRFSFLGFMPMPDVEGTLAEIAYVYDTLKLDGIGLFTSYDGKWLGDDRFTPVLEELNRRQALVIVHPLTANCCGNLISFIPDPMIEFGTDTTRTIASLIFSGAAERFPSIRWVFSHAGGTMPFLVERFLFQAGTPDGKKRLPNGPMPALRRFFYDTAQASNPTAMGGLTKVVPVSQVLFGTDFPYRNTAEHVAGIRGCGFSASELAGIERENALGLVPRLRT